MKKKEVASSSKATTETDESDLDRTTISMSADLLKRGKDEAKRQRRPFSSYVATLIERDAAAV